MDHPFRSAVFGGFHRQDVLDYLEKTMGDWGKKQKEWEEKWTQLQQDRDQLHQTVQEQENSIHSLQQQLEDTQAAYELEHHQVVMQEEDILYLRQERSALQEQVSRLEPDAVAFSTIKERSAGIELEAHCRAQTVINQAEQRVQELKDQMALWLGQVEQKYASLCTQVLETVSLASEELEKAGQALSQIHQLVEHQTSALDELTKSYIENLYP